MQRPPVSKRLTFPLRGVPTTAGLDAWVSVNGEAVSVFDKKSDAKGASGVIYVEEGQTFEVRFTDMRSGKAKTRPAKDTGLILSVDGSEANGMCIPRTWTLYWKPLNDKQRFHGWQGSLEDKVGLLNIPTLAEWSLTTIKALQKTERVLSFSKIKTTSDETLACDAKQLEALGTICITYVRTKYLGRDIKEPHKGADSAGGDDASTHGDILVHEDNKRFDVSLMVEHGKHLKRKQCPFLESDEIDDHEDPYSSVTFFYRSKATPVQAAAPAASSNRNSPTPALAVQPSIPASGSPSSPNFAPSTSARIAEIDEELKCLERQERIAELKAERKRLKGEDDDAGGAVPSNAKKMKREGGADSGTNGGAQSQKVKARSEGKNKVGIEILSLLDDDDE
ncbi:hypothetical protein JCM10213_001089 [Rhodosporidiobolus nylandii]